MALLHVDFFSTVLGMRTEMDVILPEQRPSSRLQVLYLLHGMTDDQTAWQRWTSIERYARDYQLAVIMPTTYLGWYTNMAYGERYFDYISQELPDTALGMFPAISDRREDTFVSGLSMGGYGALKCGLLRPDRFSCAAPLSGGLDAARIADVAASGKTMSGMPDELRIFRDVLGDFGDVRGSDLDLLHVAETLAPKDRPRVFMWCGTEDFLYQDNVRMRDHLTKLGYDLTYSDGPGDHSWPYWDREIQNVLRWLPLRKWGEV